MSKISIGVLFTAIALIIVAKIFDLSFAQGVSGALFVAGLAYSYVVAKREIKLLAFAAASAEEEKYRS
ncbi:hypothetical protein FGU71_04060 [Erythrobacter insulae]|uniref:Uncharacterized protein n=1 Tax=Erythrobacter insulae TaxID=2584124 RepID=A0A547PAE3_9SPHN|nr:hypothetical protein [Erythrobacter insulae]TRD11106.1 hypothetical protein FGU71_04060 [Erythrobacter insulae]